MRFKYRDFNVKQFLPDEDINLGNIISLLGRRGAGKSVLMKTLMQVLSSVIDLCIVMCPTAEANGFPDHVPRSCIYETWDPDFIEDLLDYQKEQWESGQGKEILLVLDDLSFDRKMFTTRAFQQLFKNGRHSHITVIISSQSALDMGPIRDQVDIVMTASYLTDNVLEKLFDNYYSLFNNFHDFKRTMMAITRNRQWLVMVNLFSDTNNLENRIFWYKAQFPAPKFKIGHPDIWKQDELRYVDRKAERKRMKRRFKEIQQQILNEKQPLYEIRQSKKRIPNPEKSLKKRYANKRTIHDVQDPDPKALSSWKRSSIAPSLPPQEDEPKYSEALARFKLKNSSYKRMRSTYGDAY